MMRKLNFLRIILFAIVLFIIRTVASAFLADPAAGDEGGPSLIAIYAAGYLVDALILIAVFARLAFVQVDWIYLHAVLIVVVHELLGAAVLFAFGETNPSSPLWIVDWSILVVAMIVGIEVGRRLRLRTEKTA